MGSTNGYFQLMIQSNGTFLRLFDQKNGGQPIFYDELSNYLIDRNIYEYDKIELGRALASLNGGDKEIKLTNATIYPQDEAINLTISENRLYVKARFYPPSNNGGLLNKEDILNAMVRAGVKYGADEEQILSFLSERKYCTDYIIAKALPATEGHDAVITYHFNTDLTMKPKTNEDGTVDFHSLDLISHCKRGQLLATLTPVDLGKNGIDVCGNLLRPVKVTNRVLRHGKNIIMSEDGLSIYSDVDGHVSLTDGRVFVSNVYEISGDVNTSTGDINYDGNMVIKGNVINGFSVRAKGDIEVYGVVEGAYLEAGGQIILRRGIQGMNRGILKAGGNIITKFIENSEVSAGGYITTESILHSRVSARGDITVGGRRGFVTGGEIQSRTMISVKTAGSHMGTNTLLEVGIDPMVLEEFRETEKRITELNGEKEKLTQAILLIKRRIQQNNGLTPELTERLKKVATTNADIEKQLEEARMKYDTLRLDVESNVAGEIKIQDMVYPGTKIVISNVVYHIRETIHHSKFIRDRADIKVVPL